MTYQLIYPDYLDKATGKTLVTTPGSSYTIAVAPGRNAATPVYPNDGRWASPSGVPFLSITVQEENTVTGTAQTAPRTRNDGVSAGVKGASLELPEKPHTEPEAGTPEKESGNAE